MYPLRHDLLYRVRFDCIYGWFTHLLIDVPFVYGWFYHFMEGLYVPFKAGLTVYMVGLPGLICCIDVPFKVYRFDCIYGWFTTICCIVV